ncbi:MAG: hypothetical protein A2830_00245 [Candidatus Taylorbacteria bacterium RIFCSPHIGHO2_01_FULL_44_110]|uniref:CMP/dCMP-type deaminase domain-containing protein n=1 Tax=Candidatus Taylorbacteria bacterium RIFCSPHIGHO2_12_FULL_45_16 TaxID=1802315 RepID=A0A1G2N0U0_9BACT|nr:MAG: hypothetical protein A2830_00245 [Candidatus Taylorbacteria bacterium RIFCSPHIGHO2_01_FULL_44_110]OHA28821.1 MAG: hypothetical protein A3F51_02470 [Candidatus Taylorbacteria bacterium RIFCSPHIGHO2_12_FULL_45_16]OHA32880.1 MAG: hypothetical protein A3A23_03270 [Candidatus Taylorbacteria bacterium RIFCSPLOWO2_01_FULL_45_59]OHA38624.1 MAG: hypothetical protein A3I98_01155 [Candidatus Taylorbacteria bacterium RIFCSPLOWO2_02_FULL_45_10b]
MLNDYPYIPEGRKFIYVPIANFFMAAAKRMALEGSTDRLWPTGAVIVVSGKIIGSAANQSALKSKRLMKFHREVFCVRRFLKIPTGQKYWICRGCASPRLHSEPRAIKAAQKAYGDITGADLYHWGHWWCCKSCWDAMIVAGIKDVYLVEGAKGQFQRGAGTDSHK